MLTFGIKNGTFSATGLDYCNIAVHVQDLVDSYKKLGFFSQYHDSYPNRLLII